MRTLIAKYSGTQVTKEYTIEIGSVGSPYSPTNLKITEMGTNLMRWAYETYNDLLEEHGYGAANKSSFRLYLNNGSQIYLNRHGNAPSYLDIEIMDPNGNLLPGMDLRVAQGTTNPMSYEGGTYELVMVYDQFYKIENPTPGGEFGIAGYNAELTEYNYVYGNFGCNPNDSYNFFRGVDMSYTPGTGGGTSTVGGGSGDFDNTSDPIHAVDFNNTPIKGAVDSGMIGIFNPTDEEIGQFANYLWSDGFFDNWNKTIINPLDMVVKFMLIPVTPPSSKRYRINLGGLLFPETISMKYVDNQFMSFDMGTIEVKEYWGSSLDYEPYTRIQLYLPFIGFQHVSTDEIMNSRVNIKYNIDLLTGSCVAIVTIMRDTLNSVLYTFMGNIGFDIPLSGSSKDVVSALTSATTALAGVSSSVASGPAAGASPAKMAVDGFGTATKFVGGIASSVSASKPNISRSGSISANVGVMSPLTPYLVINRPIQSLPVDYSKFEGHPSNITAKLSELTGFTSVSSVHLENIPATEAELNEINNLLKGGVIL